MLCDHNITQKPRSSRMLQLLDMIRQEGAKLNLSVIAKACDKNEMPRIYVNTKTRNKKPFFLHPCKAYDGSILAIFPKFKVDSIMLQNLCDKLNNTDWRELGFVCDRRFLFSQRSLENAMLDSSFNALTL